MKNLGNLTMEQRIEQMQKWYRSDAYATMCGKLAVRTEEVRCIVEKYIPLLPENERLWQKQTVRTEVSSAGSYMHRSYYCPSPIYDLVVGNVNRGKLLKRLAANSHTYYQFGFDRCDKLLWVKETYKGKHIRTEHLFDGENIRCGITISPKDERISRISVEQYHNGKLASYTDVLTSESKWPVHISRVTHEAYTYDDVGLLYCDSYTYFPTISRNTTFGLSPKDRPLCQHRRDFFQREDGYLARYTSKDIYFEPVTPTQEDHWYTITKKRKA